MKLVVGLGNFGDQYKKTRHNIGFMVIDKIVEKLELGEPQKKFNSLFYENNDFILIKPLTYMNKSGDAVKPILDFFKINPNNLLVVCDDLDIKIGQAKIKISKSSGGHNGIKDIINKINTNNFYRLRIGIGRPENKNIPIHSYVLQKFNSDEKEIIKKVIDKAADAVISSIFNDINFVINNFNKKE